MWECENCGGRALDCAGPGWGLWIDGSGWHACHRGGVRRGVKPAGLVGASPEEAALAATVRSLRRAVAAGGVAHPAVVEAYDAARVALRLDRPLASRADRDDAPAVPPHMEPSLAGGGRGRPPGDDEAPGQTEEAERFFAGMLCAGFCAWAVEPGDPVAARAFAALYDPRRVLRVSYRPFCDVFAAGVRLPAADLLAGEAGEAGRG